MVITDPTSPATQPFPAALLSVERARLFLWLPVLFGGAIGLYFSLPVEPPALASVPFFFAAAVLWLVSRRHGWALYPALALATLCCGFLAAQTRSAMVSAPILERELDPVMIEGEILASRARSLPFSPRRASRGFSCIASSSMDWRRGAHPNGCA
jgi:hypothetical protein